MKIRRVLSIIVLLVPGLAAAAPAAGARAGVQTAVGSYQFTLEDGRTKYVEFDARTQEGGGATGQMFFSDEAELTDQDVDGVGDPLQSHRGFYLRAEFDGLSVVNNQAVMSGTVRDSSIAGLVGQRVLLTAEDNGGGTGEPDRLTWGIYAATQGGWETSDAELERDEGVGMRWVATDAERRDDAGVEMPANGAITTGTFPLAAYTFLDLERWSGDIRVQP